ncbi:BTB/POZ domain [Popillia japonica]|uniref:BTB/POZ domain n=1 Tax=Popillia japonica TaxID=7064 RepID=A0AAW1LAN5_POPJA
METDYFTTAVQSLKKPQDKKKLLQVLIIIRKGIDDSSTKLESILDISLSILGNCCLDAHFAKNLIKLNIFHYLVRLLDKHTKDSVIGRTFRIVGNLCENMIYPVQQIIDKEPLLMQKIVDVLNKAVDDDSSVGQQVSAATVLMAVRIIRKLVKRNTLESLIVRYEVLKAIGAVMMKYVEEWEINKNNQNIVEELLRLLHAYSRYYHPNTIQSLKNTRRDLPMSEIWQRLMEKAIGDSTDTNYLEYLKSMYSTEFSMECCALVLAMLTKTQYDEELVAIQINSNIVNILIQKLEWTGVLSTIITVPSHVKRKRKGRYFDRHNSKKPRLVVHQDFYTSNTTATSPRSVSPSELSELSEISSCGAYSPNSAKNAGDLSDSDNYSPVCSDAEDIDLNSLPSLNGVDAECTTPSDEDDIVNFNGRIRHKFLFEIHVLLWRYSHVNPVVAELGSSKLLTALINISLANETSSWPQEYITAILRKSDYLLPLMQTNFIQSVHDLTITVHDTKQCSSCTHSYQIGTTVLNTLTKTAESCISKGAIAHILLSSNSQGKEKVVIAIPYIIRNKKLITRLLIHCGGLNILLNLIERKSDVQQDSIRSLCVLAIHHLKIKNPVDNLPQKQLCDLDINNYSVLETCLNVVSFKLDDGNTVYADRNFLSNRSDYFNRLLSGSFKESEQSEITLPNISSISTC